MTGRLKARRRRSLIQDLRQGTCTGKKGRRMLKRDVCGTEPGKVKTRLVPPLTHSQAASLYRCFLSDIFAALSNLSGIEIHAAYAPGAPEEKVRELVPERFGIFRQEGAHLGGGMRNAFSRLLSRYEKVSMTGTDSPDLPIF